MDCYSAKDAGYWDNSQGVLKSLLYVHGQKFPITSWTFLCLYGHFDSDLKFGMSELMGFWAFVEKCMSSCCKSGNFFVVGENAIHFCVSAKRLQYIFFFAKNIFL